MNVTADYSTLLTNWKSEAESEKTVQLWVDGNAAQPPHSSVPPGAWVGKVSGSGQPELTRGEDSKEHWRQDLASTVGPDSFLQSSLLHIWEEKNHLQYQEKFACHMEKNFFHLFLQCWKSNPESFAYSTTVIYIASPLK